MSTNATSADTSVNASNDELVSAATDLIEQFPDDADTDGDLPDTDEIVSRLDQMVNSYNVPLEEATRAARNHYLDVFGIEYDDLTLSETGGDAALDEVDSSGQWVSVMVKVVDLWEPTSDSIAQVGLIGDVTGRLKFTKWAKADLPELEEGAVYRFDNVVTSEYEGRYSINLNSRSSIEPVDDDIEVGDGAEELSIEAPMVAIQSGSGLIKRCPHEDCTRVLQDGRCAEHGEIAGEFDLRIKAVFDDGTTVQHAIFDKDATEAIADISIEDAKQQAMDALDTSVVANDLIDRLVGRYYRVSGRVVGKYLLVDEADPLA